MQQYVVGRLEKSSDHNCLVTELEELIQSVDEVNQFAFAAIVP